MTPEQARRAALIRLGSAAPSLKEQHRDVRGLPARRRHPAGSALRVPADRQGPLVFGRRDRGARARHRRQRDRLHASSTPRSSAGCRSRTPTGSTWCRGRTAPAGAPTSRSASSQDWRDQTPQLRRLAAYRDGVDEHQRRSRAARAGVRHLAHRQRVRRAPAAAAPRPRFRRRRRAARRRTGRRSSATASGRTATAPIPSVLGRTVRVNGEPATIVGVMPEGMRFPDNTELWAPFIPTDAQQARDVRAATRVRPPDGRRRPPRGAGGDERHRTAARSPRTRRRPRTSSASASRPSPNAFIGGAARPMFITVMGAVVLRAAHRLRERREPAALALGRPRRARSRVRIAMGATRWRVVRQLLIESVVLAFIGGALGLLARGRRRAGVRRGDAAIRDCRTGWSSRSTTSVFAYVAAICVLTRRAVRPRAGAARLEDEHQRRAEGRRARQHRQPARALVQRRDGRRGARADDRAARRRRRRWSGAS